MKMGQSRGFVSLSFDGVTPKANSSSSHIYPNDRGIPPSSLIPYVPPSNWRFHDEFRGITLGAVTIT